MIAANEIRIGNIVESKTHNILNACIEGIMPNGLILLKDVSTYDFIQQLEPIPLEPEILEKCGFEKSVYNRNGIIYKYETWHPKDKNWGREDFDLMDLDDEYLYHPNLNKVKYLHQLQNLYFALTNIELEINL